MRDIEHAELQQAHHFPALEAEFGDRIDRPDDLAAGGFLQNLVIERLLEVIKIGEVGPGADRLDIQILNFGARGGRDPGQHRARDNRGRRQFVTRFQHLDSSLLSFHLVRSMRSYSGNRKSIEEACPCRPRYRPIDTRRLWLLGARTDRDWIDE